MLFVVLAILRRLESCRRSHQAGVSPASGWRHERGADFGRSSTRVQRKVSTPDGRSCRERRSRAIFDED